MTAVVTQSTVVPLGRDGRAKPLRRFRIRPASTLKDEHEQLLALVGQSFCRLFGADMSTVVRTDVDIDMVPVQQWSWDDLLNALPEPYCAVRLVMPPMVGTGLVSLDMQLATAVVEKLLGGAGQPHQRDDPLTEVEVTLLAELHQHAAEDMAEALSLVVATKPVTSRQESRLELIRAVPAPTLLIALEFEIDMKTASGHLRIAIPAEALLSKLEAFAGTTTSTATVSDTGRLAFCPVETAVRFNDTPVPSSRVVDLAPGDVIPLAHSTTNPLTLYIGNVPFLSVLAGRRGTQKAFAVVGPYVKKQGGQ